jgi:hypothetical protein
MMIVLHGVKNLLERMEILQWVVSGVKFKIKLQFINTEIRFLGMSIDVVL